ncbi:uncharacterized protein LOC133790888 [Humulus lupulus]|uniref:uncharacterized protein LOC133790888 n=1 Tax=Humulus lupulus TaxID=3486 RepID=UPI002B4016E7|nr:uncharacterized protein LOC133790888 [Humulus lupulus]XP_062084706.1 uncharacterized protein LOC133790888 [Humulus lupulus]XP_062084707.1 uncharacterized protein LOC133790888 [Humulus lupulus]
MESQNHLRAHWTPAMENYFIDMMLDQAHRGNRMGHTFNKQAWNDMLMMFNAKFGSPYDVNMLKSRYTNLWKLFNDVKNLLDQNEFSWDNSRQMVVAERYVWDAYIKAHPGAQFYRNKTLVNFNDLCLIYAHTTADGRYSLSSHDIEFDDDIQPMNMGVGFAIGVSNLGSTTKERPKTNWTPAMDRYFLKLMLEQLNKGNKINNAFRRQAWKDMLNLFNTKFSCQCGKKILKHRFKKLLKYYTDLRSILGEKGFYWDEKQQRIVADSILWDNYIRAHPDARSYRKKPLLNYQDLGLIYGNAISNGVSHHFQRGKNIDDDIVQFKTGEDGEGHCAGDDHLAYSEKDPDSEGPDLMINEEEVQSDINGDHSRIDWTPSMDRCLLDIMLEQAQKLHKIDHSIDDQAWIDIVALFKDRFGLLYHKDVLRSRSKNLEKQYLDMKDLLGQRGFWWDEMQQMVKAYDDVWDTYIEEHPGAKSYRAKSKPNYNDLCLIYGDSTANRRCNRAGQYVSCNGVKLNNSYHRKNDWTPVKDRYFIDLMLEQVRNGSMLNHKFSKLAWTDIIAKFSAEFGSQYDKDVLESRSLNLRKRFIDMKSLLGQDGFVWDEMQQMIIADDDLWDAYVQEYPDLRSYRYRALPNLNDLYLIFGDADTTQKDSYSSHLMDSEDDDLEANIGEEDDQSPANASPPRVYPDAVSYGDGYSSTELWAAFGYGVPNGRSHASTEREMENIFPTMRMDDDNTFCDLQSPEREFEISDQRKKRKSTSFSKPEGRKKERRIIKEEMKKETLDEKGGMVNWLQSSEEEEEKDYYCSIEKIVAALETVPDMNEELFLEACELLEDESKAKMFVAMDVTARKKWLLRKLLR